MRKTLKVLLTTALLTLIGSTVHAQEGIRISATPTLGYSQYYMGEINDALDSAPFDIGGLNGGLTYGLRLAVDNGIGMIFVHPEFLTGSTSSRYSTYVNGEEFNNKLKIDVKATTLNIGAALAPIHIDSMRSWISLGYTYYMPTGSLTMSSAGNGNITYSNESLSGNGSGCFIESRTEYRNDISDIFKLGAEMAVGYRIGKFDAISTDDNGNTARGTLDYSGFYVRVGVLFSF